MTLKELVVGRRRGNIVVQEPVKPAQEMVQPAGNPVPAFVPIAPHLMRALIFWKSVLSTSG